MGDKSICALFKSAKDILPDSPEKKAAIKSLEEAELKAMVAEAGLAKSLGFVLCPKCWPPVVLKATSIQKNLDRYKCPSCESEYANQGKRYDKIKLDEFNSNQIRK